MSPQAHHHIPEARPHLHLLASLASRAWSLGSRDPESAAQEALKRSLQHPQSHSAVEYYFADELPEGAGAPEWPLDQLFAWLHGVLRYVVREEQARASFHREVPVPCEPSSGESLDPMDPSPDQLDALLQSERHTIIEHCLPRLGSDYRTVIRMRMDGVSYFDIAASLQISENTVATWVSRGIRTLAQCVRRRMRNSRRQLDA
ncbi:MAG TPA: sigma factor-like helix-turn-helix DNA-binding protein [Candidatus Sulfopaludibacter sp.]|nr:sigma factor-like helix-turn-helix DNA-binding protein [Candidatus Sulfopaludibacter sp.]